MYLIKTSFDIRHCFLYGFVRNSYSLIKRKQMKKTDSNIYLYKYYKREVRTFLSHLDKVKNIPNEKSIHQIRVDIKRLRAVIHLFERLSPDKFNSKEYFNVFKSVYNSGGSIRETQVNINYLSRYKISPAMVKQYRHFANENKEKLYKKFKKAVANFDTELLKKSKTKIKNLCSKSDSKVINDKCLIFINEELKKTEQLLKAGDNTAIMHNIRIHLKSLNAIVSLYYKMNPDKKLKKVLMVLKQNGTSIGNWHDKIELIKSLERFIVKSEELKSDKLHNLVTLVNRLKKENQSFFKVMELKLKPIFKPVS